MTTHIIKFDRSSHLPALKTCVIELQEFERALDSRLPAGIEIVDDYVLQMFHRCKEGDGQIFIAEIDGNVAGYAMILTKVSSDELHDSDVVYALVADLFVSQAYRRRGLGQQLLEAAERFASNKGSQWLRVGVLSINKGAQDLYEAHGFRPLFAELEKDLSDRKDRPI